METIVELYGIMWESLGIRCRKQILSGKLMPQGDSPKRFGGAAMIRRKKL